MWPIAAVTFNFNLVLPKYKIRFETWSFKCGNADFFLITGKLSNQKNDGNKSFNFYDPAYTDTDVFYRKCAKGQVADNSCYDKTISTSTKVNKNEVPSSTKILWICNSKNTINSGMYIVRVKSDSLCDDISGKILIKHIEWL